MKGKQLTPITFPLQDQLYGFSRGLFSTWLYHKRFNLLFDCGEGVATTLYNKVFGIRRLFLSHGHADHIAGLINLLNIRNLGAGNQTAPLNIYYPQNNKLIEFIMDYLAKTQQGLSFALNWIPITENQLIHLEDQKGRYYIKSFKTQHSPRQLSLGYNIYETRRKLKSQYKSTDQKLLNEIIRAKGRDEVSEDFEKILFSYAGDSRPVNPDLIRDTLFLCHECTYLQPEDDERNFQQHSFLDEVIETAQSASAETLLLYHVSLRYSLEEIKKRVALLLESKAIDCRILLLFGDVVYDFKTKTTWKGFKRRINAGTGGRNA